MLLLRTVCLRVPARYTTQLYQHTRLFSRQRLLRDAEPVASTTDARLKSYGPVIEDEYASIRGQYDAPKYPIVLAHGLFGFDELHLAGPILPGIQYWRGIKEALAAKGIEVIIAKVPPSSSIEERAAKLKDVIEEKAAGKRVNIIAHSMGGLDSRYMISQLKPENFKVQSLTTIATPHHGSHVADFLLQQIGPLWLPRIYNVLTKFGLSTGAFSQLSREYMNEKFNPKTPNAEYVRYFSYGASFEPSLTSVFRQSHHLLKRFEGDNDGLVSVESSRFGEYKGTLVGVSHLDLINWTNRLRWYLWELTGHKRKFNAIAFYLDIADMLAREGL